MSQNHLSDSLFSELDLPATILQGIEDSGFKFCTPIQAQTLPVALAGKDILGQAQTGTGKTAAFLIAALNRMVTTPGHGQPRCVILAPTRELAIQIYKDAERLAAPTGLSTAVVYGGAGYGNQIEQLEQGIDLLVATPGRLIDFFKQKLVNLKHVDVMILDEADRMFDLGFIKDIRFLLRRMPSPEKRLNLLFSATMPYRVSELAYEHMNNPSSIAIESETVTADKVDQAVYYTSNEEKIPLLLGLLKSHDMSRTLIFANTRHATNRIAGYLMGNDLQTAILSGEVPQKKRIALLEKFQAGSLPILVATDVAARGLHIPDISHVINFDLPQDPEDYVHRIGRTARAGARGSAYSFACEQYAFSLPDIEVFLGEKIPVRSVEPDLLVTPKPRIHLNNTRPNPKKGTQRGRRPQNSSQGRGRRTRAPNKHH